MSTLTYRNRRDPRPRPLDEVNVITIALALIFSVLSPFLGLQSRHALVVQARAGHRHQLLGFSFRCSRACSASGELLVLASRPFSSYISDADELIAFYNEGHGPLGGRSRCGSQRRCSLPFFAAADDGGFAACGIRDDFLEISSDLHHSSEDVDWISAARFHPADLYGYIGNDRRQHRAAGRKVHLAERDAVARSFQSLSFGVRPRQSQLGPRPVQICDRDAGVLHRWHHTAPNVCGNTNFAGTFPILDILSDVKVPENRLPGQYGVDDQASFPAGIGGQLAYPFRK